MDHGNAAAQDALGLTRTVQRAPQEGWHKNSRWFQEQQDQRFGYCMEDETSKHQGDVGACEQEVEKWTNQPYGGKVEFKDQPIVGQDPIRVELEQKRRDTQRKLDAIKGRIGAIDVKIEALRRSHAQERMLYEHHIQLARDTMKEDPRGKKGGAGASVAQHLIAHRHRRAAEALLKQIATQKAERDRLMKEADTLSVAMDGLSRQIEGRKPKKP